MRKRKAPPGTEAFTVLRDHQRAFVPVQPTAGTAHGCWVPPVVAMARYYRLDAAATVDSVLGTATATHTRARTCTRTHIHLLTLAHSLTFHVVADKLQAVRKAGPAKEKGEEGGEEEEGEDACEVLEETFGVWAPSRVWGDDEAEIAGSSLEQGGVPWGGATSEDDYGAQRVHAAWFADVRATIDGGDVVLLLVERLEGRLDAGHTHYLLVVGYREEQPRRGGHRYSLLVKVCARTCHCFLPFRFPEKK